MLAEAVVEGEGRTRRKTWKVDLVIPQSPCKGLHRERVKRSKGRKIFRAKRKLVT